MSKNKEVLKEDAFDPAPGGTAGSVNFQPGYGIVPPFSYQDPTKFDYSNYNKYFDVDTANQRDFKKTDTSGSFDKDVEQLYKGKEKPTPDDILCGIQYELQKMVKKDKRLAKELVIQNMKKYGPKYYTKLDMMNIDDKKMDVTPVMQERIKLLNQMIAEKKEKRAPLKLNSAILDILNEKRERQLAKSNELLKKALNN